MRTLLALSGLVVIAPVAMALGQEQPADERAIRDKGVKAQRKGRESSRCSD